ncbi:transglycosylase domain-containing protein [Subtercola lobariae]|uniref:Carboxypeptidase n=1 Tax=Subtercola lobariae TaxID=1588641 RepID=A0A917B1N0_9MICO|nr:transglycosylase domain-containing protein [Subtercola lobariae]GGF17029.1 carboxypeptidase [Subtercola lobariae]
MHAASSSLRAALGALLGIITLSVLAGVLVTAMVAPVIAVAGTTANSTINIFENLPDYIKPDALSQTSSLYGKNPDGSEILLASFFEQNRQSVGWNDISQYVKDALVSTEDPRFYEHGGLDVESTARALMGNFFTGGIQSGASTISQQYVKNICVQRAEAITDPDQEKAAYADCTAPTLDRKLKEMKLAIGLEKEYSKDDIMLGYLNISLFGGRVYGIQAAAEYYFGVSAKDVTLAQAASLIATVNEPEGLRIDLDQQHIDDNTARRDKDVLPSMLKQHAITQQQFDDAIATPVTPKITPPSTGCQTAIEGAGFFCDFVKKIIEQDPLFGDTPEAREHALNTGGYQIHTTLDMNLQKSADETVKYYMPYTDGDLDLGSVMVTVEPGTGRVVAMAQNKNFSEDPDAPADATSVNYSTDENYGGSTGFQTGSTYKLFTLINWLQTGHSLGDIVNGSNGQKFDKSKFANCDGVDYGSYDPQNDAGEAGGRNDVLTQFEESVNNAFIVMSEQLDACDIRNVAKSLGVHRADGQPLKDNVAAVLGTNEIAPLTMAAAYAGVINKGMFCTPIAIDSITDATGSAVAVPPSTCTQAVDPKIAIAASYAMKGVVESGNGTANYGDPSDGIDHGGKTGTTDNEESLWLVGGTTKLVTASWAGNVSGHVSLRSTTIDGPGSGRVSQGKSRVYMWHDYYVNTADAYGGDDFASPDRDLRVGQSVAVPDVTGLSLSSALAKLTDSGFVGVDGGVIASDRPAGQVAASNPPPGSGLVKGSQVTLQTSDGSLKNLPDVTGKPIAAALGALSGWHVTQVTSPDPGCSPNTVTAQSPAAGLLNQSATAVTLSVCAPK